MIQRIKNYIRKIILRFSIIKENFGSNDIFSIFI